MAGLSFDSVVTNRHRSKKGVYAEASAEWGPEFLNARADLSFGGRDLRHSLGDCVRGYGWNAYDSSLKTVANAELRFVSPRIVLDSIVPYLFGYMDAGCYDSFADASAYADESGFLASAGGGLALDLIGFAQGSVIVGMKLIHDQRYGPRDNFFWGIKFFLHFRGVSTIFCDAAASQFIAAFVPCFP